MGSQQHSKISLGLLKSRLDSLVDGWTGAQKKGTASVLQLVPVPFIPVFSCFGEPILDADL